MKQMRGQRASGRKLKRAVDSLTFSGREMLHPRRSSARSQAVLALEAPACTMAEFLQLQTDTLSAFVRLSLPWLQMQQRET